MESDRLGVGLIFVSAVGFGTLGIFGKLGANAGLSNATMLVFRFVIATAVAWAYLLTTGSLRPLRGRNLLVGLGLGALGYATMSGLYFLGLEFMSAGLVAIILYTYPAFVVLLSVAFLDERVTWKTILALGLALGGVALITGANPANADPVGVGILLFAALVYASYITVSRATLADVESSTLTAHVMPAAGVSLAVLGTMQGTLSVPSGVTEWSIIVGLGLVATALPIFTFFAGLSRIQASRASIVSTVEPVFTVALGALLLDEVVTLTTVVGGAIVLSGVILLQRG
ncbi:DMT family transporter [Haladaptatus sp. GCM10025707]|uniref:DMT family transporter n=1 Tax=unclassified Haladaptatus TaxID=2622732 RepID=UPI0023E8A9DC|nr:DMT family transporter [Haladaptatus sp. QDMS2]